MICYFTHFQPLLFSCIRCSFEQNTRNLIVYLRNLSENYFLFLFFIFEVIFWAPKTIECYHFHFVTLKTFDSGFRKLDNFLVIKTEIVKFIWPHQNSVHNCHNSKGFCLTIRLWLGLSHLTEHKFKVSFEDTINPLFRCGNDIESLDDFPLHCPQFVNERCTLLSTATNFNYNLLENTTTVLTQTILFGNMSLSLSNNSNILNTNTDFIVLTKTFDQLLFWTMKAYLLTPIKQNNLKGQIMFFFKLWKIFSCYNHLNFLKICLFLEKEVIFYHIHFLIAGALHRYLCTLRTSVFLFWACNRSSYSWSYTSGNVFPSYLAPMNCKYYFKWYVQKFSQCGTFSIVANIAKTNNNIHMVHKLCCPSQD